MMWQDYKEKVSDSRDLVIKPTLLAKLDGMIGPGLDLGCGDGDLSKYLASQLNVKVFGIDICENNINIANTDKCDNVFIVGDLTKRAVSKVGIKFKFSFSNCFLNHLDNHSVMACIDDLQSSLEEGSQIVILVPHWQRAEKYYKKIKRHPWGLTAIPEYGNKQYFRYGEWYCKAISDAGYTVVTHDTIKIPETLKDSERYGKDIGNPLFSLIIAEVKSDEKAIGIANKAFDIAHDNRKFEIDMLWKRSLIYWGFIAASFVGYAATSRLSVNLSIVFSGFGFLCSVAWSAGNRGSKYWQEYWENKVVLFQNRVTGDIFIDHFPINNFILSQFASRRMSVSKLLMGISDYTIMVWLVILIHRFLILCGYLSGPLPSYCYMTAIVATVLYSVYVVISCKSKR